ncbi:MAG: hypothetical protein COU63_05080 [Candidatus Pacebacteria bacterium CG10_big_fil_rev_8_21_14_0_10_36_11]|nr:MAG: hypothetical protein AUK08_04790 [Candidatus Pacebacteria bacterium CG2_30_36_39]PIR64311.1 MAG: hypothetical protein COU63_05080 [Candidatus Pacebacteria bacterium CG10_big_fil_rev_8_21_14_0_10_36_11]PJC43163.1 MAG: hypothetical protein CO040_00630 [Candidatus Pacebacteria bacterium CG_4_9_14_0_2_um_filter_36_8]
MDFNQPNISKIQDRPEENKSDSGLIFRPKKPNNSKIFFGLISLFVLAVGGLVGTYLIGINQDLRQQADSGTYVNGQCEPNYWSVNGQCVLENCDDYDNDGIIVCGVGHGICTEDSLGGDWCDNPNTTDHVETCGETGQIRCQCGPGSDQGYWVIGSGTGSCDDLCEDANVICTDCPPEEPPEITNPPEEPTATPPITIYTPTPTPTVNPSITITPTPTTPPGVTLTPTPTTPIGPQCRNIEMYNTTGGTSTIMEENDDAALVPNQSSVRFVCSNFQENNLPTGYFYAFRIFEPCGSENHETPLEFVNAEGENGISYNIELSGDYMAQCSVCTVDDAGDTVCDWESLTPQECGN